MVPGGEQAEAAIDTVAANKHSLQRSKGWRPVRACCCLVLGKYSLLVVWWTGGDERSTVEAID